MLQYATQIKKIEATATAQTVEAGSILVFGVICATTGTNLVEFQENQEVKNTATAVPLFEIEVSSAVIPTPIMNIPFLAPKGLQVLSSAANNVYVFYSHVGV